MSITLQQLNYFRALAQNQGRSMTRTAKTLFISQPALSYAIAALEKELGVTLFERQRQRLVLTRSGEAFLGRVNDIFAQLSDAVAEVRASQDVGTRRLTVGGVPDLTECFLHDFLRDCGEQLDPAGLTLCYRSESELAGMLRCGETDLALCTSPRGNDIECRLLYSVELYLCVPQRHPMAVRTQVEPEELNGLKLVRLSTGSPIQDAADRYLAEHGVTCATGAVQERVDDAAAFVAGGFGVGILPKTAALRHHGLQCIPLAGRPPAQTVFLGRKQPPQPAAGLSRVWELLLRYGENWSPSGGDLRLCPGDARPPSARTSA